MTPFGAHHTDIEWMVGPGRALDPQRYFIIIPDNIGHGKSSKPSDGMRAHFPQYDYDDMVLAQHELLTKGLGIDHLRLTVRFQGRDFRLTDVHGKVVEKLLA